MSEEMVHPGAPSVPGERAPSARPAITAAKLGEIVSALRVAGFADEDIAWSENAGPPADAEDFASEAIFVICNSGMKNTVARRIYERVMTELHDGGSAGGVFGHKGKSGAIDTIWRDRFKLFDTFMHTATTDDLRLSFCESLPWIGGITKYHLAKNFGVDVAKPDVHLQRLADYEGTTAQALCDRLAGDSGYKARTVDLLLWRACATGLVDSLRPYAFFADGALGAPLSERAESNDTTPDSPLQQPQAALGDG